MSQPGDAGGADLTVLLRGLMPDLQPSMARVARIIVDDPAKAMAMTITDLARRASTSETTVLRLCRHLGLKGYPQLRLALARDLGAADLRAIPTTFSGDIDPDDSLSQVVSKIAFADARAVEETAKVVSIPVLERAVSAVVAASRVDIYGVSASGFVALDLQQKLHRIGCVSFAWPDVHLALTSAALLGPGDVAIGISHTGATLDTIEPLGLAGSKGATTVAITNSPESPLAGAADLVLTTAARETTFRSGAMSSRLAQLAMVDFLFVGVAQRQFERSQQAIAVTAEAVRHRRAGGGSPSANGTTGNG